jgi:26S proteasome regulatory subunit N5
MDRREKTQFLLEQMRLLIAVARVKDAEVESSGVKDALGGGEGEWVKVRVGGRKVNEEFLKNKENEVRKLVLALPGSGLTKYAIGVETEVL